MVEEKKNGRPKENYLWKGYEGMTKAERIIIEEIEKKGKRGVKIRDLTKLTNYHPVSISHILNHLASRKLIIKSMYGFWRIKKDLKERVTIEISSNFKQDIEIKAIKEEKSIEEYIVQKIEEVVY